MGLTSNCPSFLSQTKFYVILSRATNSRDVKAILPADQRDTRTTNVIYPEALTDEVRNLLAVMRSLCSHSHVH